MSSSFNRVILMGNLTRDPEVKFTQSNKAVANIGLAINNKYKTADGATKEEVTFVDCEAWGLTAENMGKYLAKGRSVLIEGRLKTESWADKQTGANRSKLKVVVDSFQFVGPKPDGAGGGDGYAAAPKTTPVAAKRVEQGVPAAKMTYEPLDEDSIPF